MIGPYQVEPLQGSQLIQAYPIVQTVRPAIDLDEWRQHVGGLCNNTQDADRECGIMGLIGPRGYIYGFYTYRAHRCLGLGRTLDVNDFCVAAPASRRQGSAQLLRSAEDLARLYACRALDISFLVDEQWHANAHEWGEEFHAAGGFPLEGAFMPAPPSVMKLID